MIDLPVGGDPARFHSAIDDDRFWSGTLIMDNGAGWWLDVDVFKPTATNPDLALQHTTFGSFYESPWYDYDSVSEFGVFAFGTAAPPGSVPTTGSAVFDAIVAGFTLDAGRPVGGTASLQFNFGAGTLAGNLNPSTFTLTGTQVSLGTYNFVNTVFGVGSTTFSGQLQHSGTASLGAFNGLFTGPAAQELMAKWTAPYQNPDTSQWSEMFGVWVGKKP
jgi:hypothetical protein